MTPTKPYLIRAIYEWVVDNEMTPYLLVNTESPEVQVPTASIEDNSIVLNISPQACRGLHLDNDRIVFSARFGEASEQVFVPPASVMAIYASETGQGMVFTPEDDGGDGGSDNYLAPQPTKKSPPNKSKGKPSLKVVK